MQTVVSKPAIFVAAEPPKSKFQRYLDCKERSPKMRLFRHPLFSAFEGHFREKYAPYDAMHSELLARRQLFENSSVLMYELCEGRNISAANKAFRNLFEVNEGFETALQYKDIVTRTEQNASELEKRTTGHQNGDALISFTLEIQVPSGKKYVLQVTEQRIDVEGMGTRYVGIAKDITAALEEKARVSELEGATAVMVTAAHELNNPLAAVKVAASLVKIFIDSDGDERIKNLFGIITDKTGHMETILKRIESIVKTSTVLPKTPYLKDRPSSPMLDISGTNGAGVAPEGRAPKPEQILS